MQTVVIATGNAGKVAEFAHMFQPLHFGVKALGELIPGFPEPEETAPDFAGNAAIKARAARDLLPEGTWVIADDSGLSVDLLDGAPGVYSARFAARAGNGQGAADNRRELVRRLREKGLTGTETTPASFFCALHLIRPEGEISVLGRCPGAAGLVERGDHGFGYDSLFFPLISGRLSSQTFAEIDAAAKDALSHRGRALTELVRRLQA